MISLVLRIYDYLRAHTVSCVLSVCVLTSILAALILHIEFKEDISAFLPLDQNNQKALQVYQDVSGASKILAVFQYTDSANVNADEAVSAMESFCQCVEDADSLHYISELTTQIDLEKISELTDFVYNNIPYFLTENDYNRMDSLLEQDDFIPSRLRDVKQMLMFPTSGLLSSNIEKDPLNLFTPVVTKLDRTKGDSFYETYEGYIFTKDMQKSIVLLTSPFGNSETQNNSKLMSMLESVADSVNAAHQSIKVHYIGGPAIAVGNASQIKQDSILSVIISVGLIMLLLIYVFRSLRNIFMIAISIIWGWLFALGCLSIVHDEISLIVVGISSIILGIAVNYPLHLIAHCNHAMSIRQALKEIITPLVIGNITTVGAFMALIPLKANALRDLGLFSAFLLVGTILFVIIYLPHAIKNKTGEEERHNSKVLDVISNVSLENKKWLVWCIVLLTVVFGWYSFDAGFDANMSHINYMTDEQRRDMEYFQQITAGTSKKQQTLFVVTEGSTIDDALEKNIKTHQKLTDLSKNISNSSLSSCSQFLPSRKIQEERVRLWNKFLDKNRDKLTKELLSASSKEGFTNDAFGAFSEILNRTYSPKDFSYFEPLRSIFSSNISIDEKGKKYRVIENMVVDEADVSNIKSMINGLNGDFFVFDVQSMNSSLANNLSSDFNYIGWACGLIVFFFLWFSFGSIELAMLSFLPMAISWIWILGIMGMSGFQFNIVNIILATFIFGQGDDYTIFMTEGCCYEYAYRRKMVASYKSSIIVSALIMFIGIGTLILAKHPALHSLAELTIVGMFSVVLMAYVLPPLVFKWIVSDKKGYRKRPITLMPVVRTVSCGSLWIVQLAFGYLVGLVLFCFGKTDNKELLFHKFVTYCHRFDLKHMPGLKFTLHNPYNEDLSQPCIIVCNHQSMLDPMFFMALHHKILIVANQRSSYNPLIKIMFRWLGFYTIKDSNFTAWKDCSLERDIDIFRNYVQRGYSIVVFAEGARNPDSSILRYHKGPFYLAEKLNLDILPVVLHGVNKIMPIGSFACYDGAVNIHINRRITPHDSLWGANYVETTKLVHNYFVKRYDELKKLYETTEYYAPLVLDRYRYKGVELLSAIKSNLKNNSNYSNAIDIDVAEENICISNCGYGEMALMMALVHPDKRVFVFEEDEDKLTIAKYAADGLVSNLVFAEHLDTIIKDCYYYETSKTRN